MSRRGLLWQIVTIYLMVVMVTLVGVGWYAAHAFEQYSLDAISSRLENHAQYIAAQIGDAVPDDDPKLASACVELGRATGEQLAVVLNSGRVVYDSRPAPREPEGLGSQQEFRQAFGGGVGRAVRAHPSSGQRTSSVALPVRRNGQVVAAVYAALPLGEVDRRLAAIRWRIVLVCLTIGSAAALVWIPVARQLTHRLEEVRHGAERFALGELDYRLPVPESAEFATIVAALNHMAESQEQRLQLMARQNNEQRAVFASMIEAVLAIDNQERVISVNRASCELLGIDSAQVQGRNLQEVVRNADLRRFAGRALHSHEPIEADVVLHGDRGGVLQAARAALRDTQGRGIGAVVVLNDVTEFRRLEHVRRDFVANVSHELKTPISAIKGFVETLLDGNLHDPQDVERFLRIVAKQADRLNAIIEDLLSLSKIEEGEDVGDIELQSWPVRDVLEAAVRGCESAWAERQVSVRLDSGKDLHARINAPLLEQAVVNLLDNAIKYSESGSEVHVLGAIVDTEVMISVVDSGCGIAAEHLARVFERFYRVDKARSRKLGGTGLGLAIVKHIVQAHHGRVTVKSIPGAGSTFTIYLPRA